MGCLLLPLSSCVIWSLSLFTVTLKTALSVCLISKVIWNFMSSEFGSPYAPHRGDPSELSPWRPLSVLPGCSCYPVSRRWHGSGTARGHVKLPAEGLWWVRRCPAHVSAPEGSGPWHWRRKSILSCWPQPQGPDGRWPGAGVSALHLSFSGSQAWPRVRPSSGVHTEVSRKWVTRNGILVLSW